MFIQRRHADGPIAWTKQLGTTSAERAYAAAFAQDGTLVVTGSTQRSFAGFTNHGSTDVLLWNVEP